MNPADYYYRDASGREIGPIPLSALAQLRQAGMLGDETPVRAENESEWVPCREVVARVEAPVRPPATPSPRASEPNRAWAKQHSWSFFALAALCFLLPFFEFSCQGKSLLTATGLELATGQSIDVPRNLFTGETEKKEVPPQPNAGAALAFAVLAMLLAGVRRPLGNMFATAAAGIGVWQLLTLRTAIEGEKAAAASDRAMQALLQLKIEPKEGYTAALVLLAIGGATQLWLWSQARATAQARVGSSLSRSEKIAGLALLLLAACFYGGPFGLQTAMYRTPPETFAREYALSRLPASLRVGEWYEVKSAHFKYARPNIVGAREKILAAGEWKGEATFILRQTADLFRPDDFSQAARAKRNDIAELGTAQQHARRLGSTAGLPALPHPPALFAKASATGDEITRKIEFVATRLSGQWHGWKAGACWRSWRDLFQSGHGMSHGWTVDRGVAATSAPLPNSAPATWRTRPQLPVGALVAGEAATEAAIDGYLDKRRAFVDAVAKQAAAENAIKFEQGARMRLESEVAGRFHPAGAYQVKAIKLHWPTPSVAEQTAFECLVEVEVAARDDILVETTFSAQAAALLEDDDSAFVRAHDDARLHLPEIAGAMKPVRLFRPSLKNGDIRKFQAGIAVKREGPFWEITGSKWMNNSPPIVAPAETTIAAAQLGETDLAVDSPAPEMRARLAGVLAERRQFIKTVQNELAALERKWGPERANWENLRQAEMRAEAAAKAQQVFLDSLPRLDFQRIIFVCTDTRQVQRPVVLATGYDEQYVDKDGKRKSRFVQTGTRTEIRTFTESTFNLTRFTQEYRGKTFRFDCPDKWSVAKVEKDGSVILKAGGMGSDEIKLIPPSGNPDALKSLQRGQKASIRGVLTNYEVGFMIPRTLHLAQAEIMAR